MIAWRTARIFLLYLFSMAILVMMVAGVSDVPHFQSVDRLAGKAAPQPIVYPVLVIPKDAPSVFDPFDAARGQADLSEA